MKRILSIVGLSALLTAIISLSASTLYAKLISTPNLIVVQPNTQEFRFVVPANAGHGRRIFVEGVALPARWDEPAIETERKNVVFPTEFSGDIEVIIRHRVRAD